MNDNKYLPIGTICSIITSQKNVMIIGYKPVVFEKNEIKNYDYKAVYYPEGSLAINSEVYFNHISITKVIYNGYRDSSYINFNKAIGGGVEKKTIVKVPEPPTEQPPKKSNYKFDENGYVIEEEIVNPFVNNNQPEKTTEPQNKSWDIFKNDTDLHQTTISDNYQFDANRSVISESAPAVSTPVGGYQFDANGNVISEPAPAVSTSVNGYQFDANGNVISEPAPTVSTSVGRYQFDTNGNVISEPAPVAPTPAVSYRFDEYGNVTADTFAPIPMNMENKSFSQIPPQTNYKYDENGVVISE